MYSFFYWFYTVIFPLKSSRFYRRTFKQQPLIQHNEPDSVSYRKKAEYHKLSQKRITDLKLAKPNLWRQNAQREAQPVRTRAGLGAEPEGRVFTEGHPRKREASAFLSQEARVLQWRQERVWMRRSVVGRNRNGWESEDRRSKDAGRVCPSVNTANREEVRVETEWHHTFHGEPGSRGLKEVLTWTLILALSVI